MRPATTLTIVVLLAAALAAFGAVPETMSYQGVLRTAVGDLVPDGDYNLTFKLYNAEVAGNLLWQETQTISVEDGVFSAILGSLNPLSLAFDATYWLTISVGADPELTPRVELTSAPYALRAAVADVGSDADWAFSGGDIYRLSGRVGIGIPNPAYKLDVRDDVDGVTGIRIQNTDTGSSSREELRFDNEDGSLAGIFLYDDDHVYASAMAISNNRPGGHIRLATAGAERVRISNSGNVGIGVPDPSHALEVGGTAKVDGFEMDTGASNGHVLTSDASGVGTWQTPAAVPDGDWVVDGDDVYRLDGYVGIGTDSPGRTLDIREDGDYTVGIEIENRDTGAGSSEGISFASEAGSAGITAYDDDSVFYPNGLAIQNTRSGGGIQFRTSGGNRLEIDYLGRVGIGEPSPTEMLEVAGTVKMDGFELTDSPSAGHVLTSDVSGNGTWQAPAGGLTLPYAGTASDTGAVFQITNQHTGPAIEGLNTHLYGNTRGYLADIYYGVLGEDLDSGNFAYLADGNYGVYAKSFTDQAIHGRHEPSGNYAALAGPTYAGRLNGDVIVLNGGVGIGADPPTVALDVIGEVLLTSGTNANRALDIQKTYPAGVAQTVNIERTEIPFSGNDILQMTVPSGSSGGFQFVECDRGGTVEFAVDGDGHVQAEGGATVNGFLDVENDSGSSAGEFTSAYLSGTTQVVHAEYTGSGSYDAKAVYGKSKPADNYGYGGFFEGGYQGVYSAVSSAGSEWYYGVNSIVTGGSGHNYGVRGYATGTGSNYAIYGYASGGATNYAGFFNGNVNCTGTMSKGGGSFKIDHPLDPENKYLYHSFVESPDMMNIYNGNAVLDANGEARIELPEWFEALNRDFRYQLTAIGAPGPNLYVADEIVGNRFRVAGGDPGMKVSWQVTGVRQDAFAEENRIPVEEQKPPEERGKYIHPTAFGLPATMSIDHVEGGPRPAEAEPGRAELKGARARADDGS